MHVNAFYILNDRFTTYILLHKLVYRRSPIRHHWSQLTMAKFSWGRFNLKLNTLRTRAFWIRTDNQICGSCDHRFIKYVVIKHIVRLSGGRGGGGKIINLCISGIISNEIFNLYLFFTIFWLYMLNIPLKNSALH